MDKVLLSAASIQNSSRSAVLCIITKSIGSTPRKAGSKMLVFSDGNTQGSVGGGRIEYLAIEESKKMMNTHQPKTISYDLDADVGMQCGGKMNIYFEPINSANRLLIFGAGHIGNVLAKMAVNYGFQIILIDNREAVVNEKIPEVEFVCQEFPEAYHQIEFRPNDFIVVTTYKHIYDEEIVAYVLQQPYAYLGMIASKRKAALARKKWLDLGISKERIDTVFSPIGLEMKCETPEEIALSILSQLVDEQNKLKK